MTMTQDAGGPGTYDQRNMPPVPAVQLDDPNTPSHSEFFANNSPTNLWDTLTAGMGTVTEQPDVDGPGTPAAGEHHQESEAIEDVGVSAETVRTHVVVHHVMETVSRAAPEVRPRTIVMDTNGAGTTHAVPTRLLDANPNRARAVIKVLGTAQTIVLARQGAGGNSAMGAGIANGGMGYQMATGDTPLTITDQSAIEAYLVSAGPCPVSIWEELNATSTGQDLSAGGVVSAL